MTWHRLWECSMRSFLRVRHVLSPLRVKTVVHRVLQEILQTTAVQIADSTHVKGKARRVPAAIENASKIFVDIINFS